MSQEASETKTVQAEEVVEEAASPEKVEKEAEEPVKENSENSEAQESHDEANEQQESHDEANEDETKEDSNEEKVEIREPPIDVPDAKETLGEVPQEDDQITEDIVDKIRSSQTAESNSVENE